MSQGIEAVSRVLIVGFGSIGRRHANILHHHFPSIELALLRHASCSEPVPELGIAHCYTSVDEALHFFPDAAVIANPASFHLEVALPLASAGVHLFVEKPLSNSIDTVETLINVANRHDIRLMVGYNLRFSRSLQLFRAQLHDGVLGKIVSVHAEVGQYLPSWRQQGDYREQVSAQKSLGGGALLELSHEIDYLMWLFGKADWVFANTRQSGLLEIDVEDVVNLLIGFSGCGQNGEWTVSVDMDFIRHDTTRQCVVIGEYGTLKWNAVTNEVLLFCKGGKKWETLYLDDGEEGDSYYFEWEHFLHCVTNKEKPLVDGMAGLDTLRVIDAARLSDLNQIKVNLNWTK